MNLPVEILECIAVRLPTAKDIISFARASQKMSSILPSALYIFNVQCQNSSGLIWAAQQGNLRLAEALLRYRANVNTVDQGSTPLICAAVCRSEPVLNLLLTRQGIDVNFRNQKGQCVLWWAARRGYIAVVEQLLRYDGINIDCPDVKHKWTPLAAAVAKGHTDIVQSLLATGRANINTRDVSYRTPIYYAIGEHDRKTAEILLAHRHIDLTCKDERERTPLIYSVLRNFMPSVPTLLAHPQVVINAQDEDGRNALWHAVSHGDKKTVQQLLAKGGDIAAADSNGITPLHQSIKKGHTLICKILLSHSADALNLTDEWGQTLLHLAAAKGCIDVVKLLLNEAGVDVQAHDIDGSTPLHKAAERGHLVVVKLLLAEPNTDINARDTYGLTPLWLATKSNRPCVVRRLLAEDQVDVNAGLELSTSLHHAVENKDKQIVRLLLDVKTLDPNVPNEIGWTPLNCAAHEGDLDIIKLLLSRRDVRVNAIGLDRKSPLWLAVRGGHCEVVRWLLQYQTIDINQGQDRSPLMVSIEEGYDDIAMLLLAQKERLDINARTYLGSTALFIAARKGSTRIVDQILKDSRADINSKNKWGETALWHAASNGQESVVRRLLADPRIITDIKDEKKRGPLEMASEMYHFGIAQLLENHGHGIRPKTRKGCLGISSSPSSAF